MVAATPRFLRTVFKVLIGAVLGGIAFYAVGRGFALIGGSCSFLCRPEISGPYGALTGIVVALTFEHEG